MSKRLSTVFAGSALLLAGGAFAQEPGESQSQSQEQQTQEQMDRSSTGSSSSEGARSDDYGKQRTGATDSQDDQSQTDQSQTDRSKSQADRSKSTRMARAGGAQPVLMMVMIPVSMETKVDQKLADGCWAKLYDDYNYGGDSLTLVGPLDQPRMVGPFGVDWDDKVSSIKTGPKATVTIYDNENFRDRSAKIKPEQEVPELTEKMGFFEEPNSLRINCGGTTAAN